MRDDGPRGYFNVSARAQKQVSKSHFRTFFFIDSVFVTLGLAVGRGARVDLYVFLAHVDSLLVRVGLSVSGRVMTAA